MQKNPATLGDGCMNIINQFSGDNFFLSNFYPCKVKYNDEIYNSVEAAYQAAKTTDKDMQKLIQHARTPGMAKRIGRQVVMRPHWENIKVSTMSQLLADKFSKGDRLTYLLIETGDSELVEGNTWGDTFWGVSSGDGKNMLGKLLMAIREEVKWLYKETK